MKKSVHISVDEKVLQVVRIKKETEGFCFSRSIEAHFRGLWKDDPILKKKS